MRFTGYTFCLLKKLSHPETESLRGRNSMLWPGCVKIVTSWKIDEWENFVTRCEHLFVSTKPVYWIEDTFCLFFPGKLLFLRLLANFQHVKQINNRAWGDNSILKCSLLKQFHMWRMSIAILEVYALSDNVFFVYLQIVFKTWPTLTYFALQWHY